MQKKYPSNNNNMASGPDWNALLDTLSAKLSAENDDVLVLQDQVDELMEKQDPIAAELKEAIATAYSTPGELDEFDNYVDEFGYPAPSSDEIHNANLKIIELKPINDTYTSTINKMEAVIKSKITTIKEIEEQIRKVKLAIEHEKKARQDAEREIEERARQAEEARRIEEERIRQAEEQVRRLEEEQRIRRLEEEQRAINKMEDTIKKKMTSEIQTPPQRRRISMQRKSSSKTPQTPITPEPQTPITPEPQTPITPGPQKKRTREDALEESIEEVENPKLTKKQNTIQDKELSKPKRKRDRAFSTEEDIEEPTPKRQDISTMEGEPISQPQRSIEIEEPIETEPAPITKVNDAPLTTIQPPIQWDSEPLPSVEPIHTQVHPLSVVDIQPSSKVFGILF